MIKISSFSPKDSFSRRTWEFYDEYLTAKIKSLTSEYEIEVRYETIKAIQNQKSVDTSWLWVTFFIIGILGTLKLNFNYFDIAIPAITVIEKVVMIFALAFALPSFRKDEVFVFLDSDRNTLAKILISVKVDEKNKRALLEAIQLIKQRTEITSEVYLNDPLPGISPVFEFTELNVPDFVNRSTVRFYEDKLIDVEKSLVEEVMTVIKYDELTGKTKIARMGNNSWDTVGCYWLIFVSITTMLIFVFFPQHILGNLLFTRMVLGGFLLLIPLFLLKYIKSEILIFYDREDEGVFLTRVNSANHEKLKQVIEFIQGKILEIQEKPA